MFEPTLKEHVGSQQASQGKPHLPQTHKASALANTQPQYLLVT